MPFYTLAGSAATIAGCLCMYSASPHQRWWGEAWPKRPARGAAIALWGLGGWCLAQAMQRATATFFFCTVLMLACTVLPYIGALLHVRRTR